MLSQTPSLLRPVARSACLATVSGLAVIIGLTAAWSVSAQEAPVAADKVPAKEEITVVTVTGTNVRGVKPVGSEAVSITRQQILATGLSNPTDVVRTLPQVQNLGYDESAHTAQNGAGNVQKGSSINLRGIGSNATLLLVDGHRLAPSGTVVSFTESNQVPVSALERVEVVADGASAIYGSDAVSGVVNYVIRKNLNGVELSARYGGNDDYDQSGESLAAGKTWSHLGGLGHGNVMFTYDHSGHGAMLRGKSDYLRQDLTQFGGADNRQTGCAVSSATPGNVMAGCLNLSFLAVPTGAVTVYGLPYGSGVGLTAADLNAGQANLVDSSDYTDYVGKTTRDQYALFFNQALNDDVSIYYEGIYSERETVSRTYPLSYISLNPGTPFYIDGLATTYPGQPLVVPYSFVKDFGYGNTTNQNSNLSQTVGFRWSLPRNWRAEGYFTAGTDRACGVCNIGVNVNTTALQAEVDAGRFNPLSSDPISADELAKVIGTNIQQSRNNIEDTVLKFDGPLFDLPGGTVRAAVGAEYTKSRMQLLNYANRGVTNEKHIDSQADLSRTISSYFAEFYVPLVGEGNALPFMKALNLSLAFRSEDYSDFGKTTNPKIGLTWDVNDSFSLRASGGTSFRAPTLADLDPHVFSGTNAALAVNNSGDATIPIDVPGPNLTTVLQLIGSNPDLKPETAKNLTLGFDWHPQSIEGLRLSGTYYSIKYEDQIVGLATVISSFLATPENRALYANYIIATPQPSTCIEGDESTYNPLILPYLHAVNLYGSPITNACGIRAVEDARNTNAATTDTNGVDLQASYDWNAGGSHWRIGGAVTKILKNDQSLTPGTPTYKALDRINFPVSLRGRAEFAWSRGVWNANAFINYVGGYTNDLPLTINGTMLPVSEVPAWTTVDTTIAYSTGEDAAAWAQGVRLSLSVQNLFDRKPPTVLSTNGDAFDNQNANFYGRSWAVQVSKAF